MKKTVSLSLFEADKASPILFMGDIEENIPTIKEMGYDGVDLFVSDPEEQVAKRAVRLLGQEELEVGVVMPAALAKAGLSLGDESQAVREKAIDSMKGIIEYAGQLNAMVSLGLIRGSVRGSDSKEELLKRFADSIETLLPYAKKNYVDFVIEPINRYEINTLNSSKEALRFIKDTKLPVYLMLDTFHMNIEDDSIEGSLCECRDYIKHIHFLDSNRLAPGMGHLDMRRIYHTLKKIGYDGHLCLEALAIPDALICAKNGIAFFKSIHLE